MTKQQQYIFKMSKCIGMILYCLQQRHDLDFLRVEKVSEAGGVPAPHEEQRLLL